MTKHPWITIDLDSWTLHCQRCGQSYQVNLPVPVDVGVAILDSFGKVHRSCEPKPAQHDRNV